MSPREKSQFKEAWLRGESVSALAEKFNVSRGHVSKLRQRMGLPPRGESAVNKLREAPPDLHEVAAMGLSMRKMCAHWRMSPETLHRLFEEHGVTQYQRKVKPPKADQPADWFEVAPTMHLTALSQHYGLGVSVVRRLVRETGVTIKKSAFRPGDVLTKMGKPAAAMVPRVEASEVSQAAHYLRRFYRNVHRCDIPMYGSEDPERRRVTWGDLRNIPNGGRGYYYIDRVGVVANNRVIELAAERRKREDKEDGLR